MAKKKKKKAKAMSKSQRRSMRAQQAIFAGIAVIMILSFVISLIAR